MQIFVGGLFQHCLLERSESHSKASELSRNQGHQAALCGDCSTSHDCTGSSEEKRGLFRGFVGDEVLPRYRGVIVTIKDPFQTAIITKSKSLFFSPFLQLFHNAYPPGEVVTKNSSLCGTLS